MRAEHRHVTSLKQFGFAVVHVDAARETRIEAAHRAHDVDALEFLRAILFEDRRVLYSVFVGSGRAVNVARIGVPRCWRIWMIISDLAVANDYMMREHAPDGLVESATNRLLRHFEFGPGFVAARVNLFEGHLIEVISRRACIRLKIGAGTVTLNGVRPL